MCGFRQANMRQSVYHYIEWNILPRCHAFNLAMRLVSLSIYCRGSVVACTTYKQEITGLIPGWAELCFNIVLLGKVLCPHMHSLNPGVRGCLVGQWRLAFGNSSKCWKWQLGCMLPGELRWLMNDQGLCEVRRVALCARYQTINLHLLLLTKFLL